MKKFIFTSVLALTGMVAAAQSDYQLPDGLLAIELQANPFSNDFNTFKMGELKGRLFLDNKSVIRVGVGIGIDSDKNDDSKNYDDRSQDQSSYTISKENTQTKINKTELRLSLGYEYHFANAGRMDFYGGVEAGYEGKFFSGTVNKSTESRRVMANTEALTSSYDNKEYTKMIPGDSPSYNEHSIFANVFTGLDFFIYKGLYIGTELGISFKTGKEKNGYYTQTRGEKSYQGTEIKTDWTENYSSQTGIKNYLDNINKTVTTTVEAVTDHSATTTRLKVYVEPAIRIGWLF